MKTKCDTVMISLFGLVTAHATGPHAQTHSETGRYTQTLLFSPKVFFWMTLLFFFLLTLSHLDPVRSRNLWTLFCFRLYFW